MNGQTLGQEEVSKLFTPILNKHKMQAGKIVTKTDLAAKEQDTALVSIALGYTQTGVSGILNSAQESLTQGILDITERLQEQIPDLEVLKQAIKIERERFNVIRNIRIVAEATEILRQKHALSKQQIIQEYNEKEAALLDKQDRVREEWETGDIRFENEVQAHMTALDKARQKAAADLEYERKREDIERQDEFSAKVAKLQRMLAETDAIKHAEFDSRRDELDAVHDLAKQYLDQVATFDEEIAEVLEQARKDAIKAVHDEADLESQLLEQEFTAKTALHEQQMAAYEQTLMKNEQLIQSMRDEVTAARTSMQELSQQVVS